MQYLATTYAVFPAREREQLAVVNSNQGVGSAVRETAHVLAHLNPEVAGERNIECKLNVTTCTLKHNILCHSHV